MNSFIVGFGHKAQVGKDEAGRLLVNRYGYERLSFGDHLKKVTSTLTGVPLDEFYSEEGKLKYNSYWNKTHRQMLQEAGQALRQGFDLGVWIKGAFSNLRENGLYVMTDVRHVNEVEAIKAMGGVAVRIDRDTSGYEIDRNHPSETGLDGYESWDYYVSNSGTLEQFHDAIDAIMYKIKVKQTRD